MSLFVPKRVFYEPEALEYPLGRELAERFENAGIPVSAISAHNRVTGIPGKNPRQAYVEGKRSLVLSVRKEDKLETCKPAAHYQLPFVSSCPGMCEYCYLATTGGKKPYLRVYVNTEEILAQAKEMLDSRKPALTTFEGSSTSDPLSLEEYTGVLRRTIEFFGAEETGRFTFSTKFTNVDDLLVVNHQGHTRVRFSINCEEVVRKHEKGTPLPAERVKAALKMAQAGYPIGFIVAPIIWFDGWEEEYGKLFADLAIALEEMPVGSWQQESLTFEFITYRFTSRAKTNILSVFPQTTLPLHEEFNQSRFDQIGFGKYGYRSEEFNRLNEFFMAMAEKYFPYAKVEYFI